METGMALKNIPGPYRIPNYRARGHTVATNKSPIGPYRGVARPAACFTIERVIDEVAAAVGREPYQVRMDNMVTPDLMPYRSATELLYDNGDYPASVEKAVELIGLDDVRRRQRSPEPDGRLIGAGFAAYTEQTAHGCGEWVTRGVHVIPGFESATARLMTDGTLVLLTGIQRHGDSALSPFGMGTFASRSMVMAGGAVARACREIRDQIAVIAAHMLQCKSDEIELRDGAVFGPRGDVSFADIGHAAYLRQDGLPPGTEPMVEATATYEPGIATGVFCYSTHAAVVAVDPATGAVEILDYGVVEDCGTIVNPLIVDGQIAGGVAQGIGTALYEEIPYSADGQPLATTLMDYLMPGATEIPDIKIAHMTTPTEHTEYGMKGMGEGGAISPPAAIANAIRDALAPLGAEVNETPATPARVFAALAEARGRKTGEAA
jgi:carbon-monoxide dehydrogenase large subunit